MYATDPPDTDPREDEPECICGNPDEPHPDCYYHGVEAVKELKEALKRSLRA